MRLKPQAQTILALLRRYPDGLTPLEGLLNGGGFRMAARVHELRQAGYAITATCEGNGIWRYRIEEREEAA